MSFEEDDNKEFKSVYYLLDENYLYAEKELQAREVYNSSIENLMNSIQDPFTGYYNPEEAQELISSYTTPVEKKLIGIGTGDFFLEETPKDTVVITMVYQDSPAEKAGLQIKDRILKVNSLDVTGSNAHDLFFNAIDNQDKITLSLQRKDSLFSVEITKQSIVIPSVINQNLNDSVNVIHITGFQNYTFTTPENPRNDSTFGSWAELRNALEKSQGHPHTILDLRSNPGGSIFQCMNMASEFLNKGDTLALIDDRGNKELPKGTPEVHKSEFAGNGTGRNLVIMANERSASCAEIMVMAIRSNREVPFVGQKTYGKGIGQSFLNTHLQGILKVTSLGIYDKNKSTYNAEGLQPSHTVEDPLEQNKLAYSLLTGSIIEASPRRLGRKNLIGLYESKQDLLSPFLGGAYVFSPTPQ